MVEGPPYPEFVIAVQYLLKKVPMSLESENYFN